MAARAVACSSCQMWAIREQSSLPDNFVCRKCVQLQLLTDSIVRLERQVDALRSIQEAESVIDTSYREVVTPQVQTGRWVTTRRGRQVVQEFPVAIPL